MALTKRQRAGVLVLALTAAIDFVWICGDLGLNRAEHVLDAFLWARRWGSYVPDELLWLNRAASLTLVALILYRPAKAALTWVLRGR